MPSLLTDLLARPWGVALAIVGAFVLPMLLADLVSGDEPLRRVALVADRADPAGEDDEALLAPIPDLRRAAALPRMQGESAGAGPAPAAAAPAPADTEDAPASEGADAAPTAAPAASAPAPAPSAPAPSSGGGGSSSGGSGASGSFENSGSGSGSFEDSD